MTDESEIRRRFAQLRESDRVRAPTFAQIYGRTRARRTSRATPRVRPLLIDALVAVVIGAALVWHSQSSSPSTVTETIATWRAPTDVLLTTPGSELLSTMPALNKSVLDKMIPTPSKRGT
jgi:hypothetical protein